MATKTLFAIDIGPVIRCFLLFASLRLQSNCRLELAVCVRYYFHAAAATATGQKPLMHALMKLLYTPHPGA